MRPSVMSLTTTSVSNIAAVKSVSGMGCSSTRPLAGVQEPQGLLNIQRAIHDLVDAPVRFALKFLISHCEHFRLPDHYTLTERLGSKVFRPDP